MRGDQQASVYWSRTEASPVEQSTRRAKELFARLGAALCDDEGCGRFLSAYREGIEATRLAMQQTGMVETCSRCASGPSGSCCFEGVEQWYDDVLLLINLMLGAKLSARCQIPGHCQFLGDGGCTLPARHSFCINYLCAELSRSMGAEQRQRFLSIAGREIMAGWELECFLRRRIASVK